MQLLYETLEELQLLDESAKTDFIDKFGDETFNNFNKAKQRIINKGYSPDYQQYLKMTQDEINNFIINLYDKKDRKGNDLDAQKRRNLQGEAREVRGEYKFFGEHGGYLIYQPLDYISSMDLGINTGWCTAGRYGHAGHPDFKPSEADAKKHFDDYASKGVKLYYFLNPQTFYGEYAIALYPYTLNANRDIYDRTTHKKIHLKTTDIELFNANDDNIWFKSDIIKLFEDVVGIKVKLEFKEEATAQVLNKKDLDIRDIILLSIEEAEHTRKKFLQYNGMWWLRSAGDYQYFAADAYTDGSVNYTGNFVNRDYFCVRPALIISNLKSLNLSLGQSVELFGKCWVVISEDMILYDDEIIKHRFDEKSNDYDKSEIKEYIHELLRTEFNKIDNQVATPRNNRRIVSIE